MDKDGSRKLVLGMGLSTQEIAAAVKTHASVRYFERTKNIQLWSSALYGGAVGISVSSTRAHHDYVLWIFYVGTVAGLLLFQLLMRRLARSRYERDKLLLQILEREHADELPWIEEEVEEARVKAHLAAVAEIQREVAQAHAG